MPRVVHRQGDVVLEPIDELPRDVVKVGDELRVRGETGHEHILKGTVYERPKSQTATPLKVAEPMTKWVDVGQGGALIRHTEANGHPAKYIPQGLYFVHRVRNYTFGKIRDVVD